MRAIMRETAFASVWRTANGKRSSTVEAERQPRLGGDQAVDRGADIELGDALSCSAVTS